MGQARKLQQEEVRAMGQAEETTMLKNTGVYLESSYLTLYATKTNSCGFDDKGASARLHEN